MCIDLIAAGVGLSLAGSAASFAGQSAYASAVDRANKATAERNQDLARKSAANSYEAIGARVAEEEVRAGLEASKIASESLQARGRVSAAAVEAGVKGASLDALLADFERQEGQHLTAISLNEQFVREQSEREKVAQHIGLESRLVASTPPVVQRPNLLSSALGAFSNALSTGLSINSSLASIKD